MFVYMNESGQVEYYSKTNKIFVPAEVKDVQFNEAKEIKRVDLTVKNRADISRGPEIC